MFIPYCDESIDLLYMTLNFIVFCRVTSEDEISMNFFTVLGPIGWRTYLWIRMISHVTRLHIHSVDVVSQLERGWCP
jgi:hypothetical protein